MASPDMGRVLCVRRTTINSNPFTMNTTTPRPTPETNAFILANAGFGPTDHQWREHSRDLERERDRLAEELSGAAADFLNKEAVFREILTLAKGLNKHGPAGMSQRTARAILAALSRVLPGIEVPPLIEPTAAECGQYADKATEKIMAETRRQPETLEIGANVVALLKCPLPVKELAGIIDHVQIAYGPGLRMMEKPKGWLQFFKP